MIGLKRFALLKHGAPPRNVLEAALRAKWGGGGASYEKTVGPAPIISISDAKPKPAKSLIVGMEPIQDLHGYDNPWPAGGGVNKVKLSNAFSSFQQGTYGFNVAMDGERIKIYGTYSGTNTSVSFRIGYFDTSTWDFTNLSVKGFVVSGLNPNQYYQNVVRYGSANKTDLAIDLINISTNQQYTILVDVVFYEGSTAPTAWTPYSNLCPISGRTGVTVDHSGADTSDPQTYPVMFPDGQTVYGGTVDLVTGVLTVEYVKKIVSSFDGIFGAVTNGYCVFVSLSDTTHDTDKIDVASMKSNLFKYSGLYRGFMPLWSYGGTSGADPTQVFILPSTITSLDEANAWLSALDVPLECTFKLAEPQTYQLTPQQIQLLKGSNTLWSDADELTLTYLGTTPPNLLGGMLGGGFGGVYTPPEEEPEEEEQGPEEEQAEESDPEEVIPDGE